MDVMPRSFADGAHFASIDARYCPGGIYEKTDTVPQHYLFPRKKPVLTFLPRCVARQAAKSGTPTVLDLPRGKNLSKPSDKKYVRNEYCRGQRRKSSRRHIEERPKYSLRAGRLESVLEQLSPFPFPSQSSPEYILPKDIRDAQDPVHVFKSPKSEAALALDSAVNDFPDASSLELSKESNGLLKDTPCPWSEGQFVAIKSHRTLAYDEYPTLPMSEIDREDSMIFAPKLRFPVSMDINAFLNSKQGCGKVYMGVAENREIKGLFLTADQKEHVAKNLDDLLTNRYRPSVPRHRYRIEFLRVRDEDDVEYDDCIVDFTRPHLFRSSQLCWCDTECLKNIGRGRLPRRYVVVVVVLGPNETFSPTKSVLYNDEVGCVCVRKGVCNAIPSVEKLINETIKEIDELYLCKKTLITRGTIF